MQQSPTCIMLRCFIIIIENAQSIGKLLKHLIFDKIPHNNPFQKNPKILIFL